MYCRLVTKSGNHQKIWSTFWLPSMPDIENYLLKKEIRDLSMHIVVLGEVQSLLDKTRTSLVQYFENDHIEYDYTVFMGKDIRKIKFLGTHYHLSLGASQFRDVRFFNTLQEVVKNKEEIILYEKNEIDRDMIDVLNIINSEESINNEVAINKTTLIEKTLTIKPILRITRDQDNYSVDRTLSNLEEKGFITINGGFVLTTPKGKLLTDVNNS